MARPTIYDEAVADSIMENMVEDALTPSEAIAAAGVNRKTWYGWLLVNESLPKRWDAAMENLSDRYADEAQHIAKSRKGDAVWARLYIDVLKWRCSKLNPRRYGADGYVSANQEVTVGVTQQRVPLTPLEVADRVSQLLADAEKSMSIVPPPGTTDADRMKAILDSDQPMPPALYEIWSKATFDGSRH